MTETGYTIEPIGVIRSALVNRKSAPRQGNKGAPDAWLHMNLTVLEGLEGLEPGAEIIVITWLHKARRDTLRVHPHGDKARALAGVFTTRSPDRPNPLGLHRVRVLEIIGDRMKVGPMEAIDGTPVVDIKPVLSPSAES